MAEDEEFRPRLGRIGKGGRDRFTSRVTRAANLAGGVVSGVAAKRRFDGSRIGRGAGVGRVLSYAPGVGGRYARRVVVKASIVRLGSRGLSRATAHMRYLQRDGTMRDGGRGGLYGAAEGVEVDGKAFVERGAGDRHQFRFIVAPEDGSEYEDLRPLVRRLMEQAEKDLGTRLDWVAVDHFNTGHPHSHVLLRGKDDGGRDLVIARDYLTRGLRERAAELVNLDLGPRTELELRRAEAREIGLERFTGIDRRLVASVGADGLLDPRHRDRAERDLRIARLRQLEILDLARPAPGGRWSLDTRAEPVLRELGRRGDIIRTMQRALGAVGEPGLGRAQAIYDPARDDAGRLVGRLVATGLSDEHADRRFLILDGVDGRTHYVDLGDVELEARRGAVLAVAPRRPAVREADRAVARIAAMHGGRYSAELHQIHDPGASEGFVRAHERRLEAMRRAGAGPVREVDGTWTIPGDHLERAGAYERKLAVRRPVALALLSERGLEGLPHHDGVTWLDRELVSGEPAELRGGFGDEVRRARALRLQWLAARELAENLGDAWRCRPDMIEQLERREVRAVAARHSRVTGRQFVEHRTGEKVTGTLTGKVRVGDRDFARIEKSREFALVPWRPVLEQRIGREVSGIVGGGGISWTFGRERGPEIGM